MAKKGRPQEFDEDMVLRAASCTFIQNGYEGTTLDLLMESTGLSRQSIYNLFGNKQKFYAKCLEYFHIHNILKMVSFLNIEPLGEGKIRSYLDLIAQTSSKDEFKGCILTGSMSESISRDKNISQLIDKSLDELREALKVNVNAVKFKENGSKLSTEEIVDTLFSVLITSGVLGRRTKTKQYPESLVKLIKLQLFGSD